MQLVTLSMQLVTVFKFRFMHLVTLSMQLVTLDYAISYLRLYNYLTIRYLY